MAGKHDTAACGMFGQYNMNEKTVYTINGIIDEQIQNIKSVFNIRLLDILGLVF